MNIKRQRPATDKDRDAIVPGPFSRLPVEEDKPGGEEFLTPQRITAAIEEGNREDIIKLVEEALLSVRTQGRLTVMVRPL
ncbi:MAG: hypothetical protein L7F78_20480 [Syntrophales bacterium LBB04]|nr:hypothetical protein [Syntrophales bacterium LBB04]